MKRKISMTIDRDVYDGFKDFCQKNGMKVSTKVELLMREATTKDQTLKKFIEQIK